MDDKEREERLNNLTEAFRDRARYEKVENTGGQMIVLGFLGLLAVFGVLTVFGLINLLQIIITS